MAMEANNHRGAVVRSRSSTTQQRVTKHRNIVSEGMLKRIHKSDPSQQHEDVLVQVPQRLSFVLSDLDDSSLRVQVTSACASANAYFTPSALEYFIGKKNRVASDEACAASIVAQLLRIQGHFSSFADGPLVDRDAFVQALSLGCIAMATPSTPLFIDLREVVVLTLNRSLEFIGQALLYVLQAKVAVSSPVRLAVQCQGMTQQQDNNDDDCYTAAQILSIVWDIAPSCIPSSHRTLINPPTWVVSLCVRSFGESSFDCISGEKKLPGWADEKAVVPPFLGGHLSPARCVQQLCPLATPALFLHWKPTFRKQSLETTGKLSVRIAWEHALSQGDQQKHFPVEHVLENGMQLVALASQVPMTNGIAAALCARELPGLVQTHLQGANGTAALHKAFEALDQLIMSSSHHDDGIMTGCSLSAALFSLAEDNKVRLFVAHVGDNVVVLRSTSGTSPRSISESHRCSKC